MENRVNVGGKEVKKFRYKKDIVQLLRWLVLGQILIVCLVFAILLGISLYLLGG